MTVDHVDMSTVLSIHVWEWSDQPGYQCDVAIQRGPDYGYLVQAETRTYDLYTITSRAETALHVWRHSGLIGLVSYFESFPDTWTHKEY